jgi:hypothetical protein
MSIRTKEKYVRNGELKKKKTLHQQSWIAPLVNGRIAPLLWIKARRTPLSPLLYIIMGDFLSRKLEAESISGNLPSIKLVSGEKSLNPSQFADNTLLMGEHL